MMIYNSYAPCSSKGFHHARTQAVYTYTTTPKCEKAFMSTAAFRVLLRSIAGGCRGGRLVNEDGVQLYGWRIREKDGSLSAIITDVVESSPHSRRTSITFDVDHDYAIHRDHYLRDVRCQQNYSFLGYIHSHPDHMTHFSQTDVDTMAEYTRSDMEVMLSGLVTLYRGELELTMYAATQSGNQMSLWNLPLMISDEYVNSRLPKYSPKPYDQIWREASGTDIIPNFKMLDGSEAFLAPDKSPADLDASAMILPDKSSVCKPTAHMDTSAIVEGGEGVLCGRMQNGRLHLYFQPGVLTQETIQEASPACVLPADSLPSATDIQTGEVHHPADSSPTKEE